MKIGVPKEIKNNENRVALTPSGVMELTKRQHKVIIEKNAGLGSGITDEAYMQAGAIIYDHAEEVFADADIIVKVKEPLPSEYELFKQGQILFTYLHLAANEELTKAMLKSKIIGIAYETVEKDDGKLPLLIPMSEVAGRMATQVGAYMLQKYNGGRGILLGGVPGTHAANVVVIGGGIVGMNAARMAIGLGANVTILDIDKNRLCYLDEVFDGKMKTLISNQYNIEQAVEKADLLIGAVLVTGAKAPTLVTADQVKKMKKGAVVVDVAIDQGGSIETIDRVTTHDEPCYEKFGVMHYSVANMPGAVPITSTYALTDVTLPYLVQIAEQGVHEALKNNSDLLRGLNVYEGNLTCKAVADTFDMPYVNPLNIM